jgi:hypothetical protein
MFQRVAERVEQNVIVLDEQHFVFVLVDCHGLTSHETTEDPARLVRHRTELSDRSVPTAFKERDAATFLGVSVFSLRKWRSENRGPRYVKFAGAERKGRGKAGRVSYRRKDLEAYLDDCTVQTDPAPMPTTV